MARAVATGEYECRRTDSFITDPRAIVVNWRNNLSRQGIEPPVDEELMELGRSMMPKDKGGRGQLEPVTCRSLGDKRPELVAGFRRLRAGLWLIESGECPDFQIRCELKTVTDKEAALDNFEENVKRKDLSPVEQAHVIRSLQESYGFSVTEIAEKLHWPESKVRKVGELTALPERIQESVSNRKTSVSTALELGKLPPAERDAVFNAAEASGEPVKAKDVRSRLRDHAASTGATKAPGRTVKEVKTWLDERTGVDEPVAARNLAVGLVDWIGGKMDDAAIEELWDKAFARKGAK